jgi:iron complex transport system ATP-binding protein
MKNNAIEVQKLNYSVQNKPILHAIELSIEKGNFYGIVGPNGSGKTTFLRALSKVLTIGNRSVFVEGKDINQIPEKALAQQIACVPQNTYIESNFTALDVVLMGRAPYKKQFERENVNDLRLVKEAMASTNTWHLKDIPIQYLSGGEKQRVVIARALAQRTEILLLDEPVSNLDIHHQVEILNLLQWLNTSKNITIIAVLHDLNHVLSYTQKVFLLNGGELVAHGNTPEVLTEEHISQFFSIDAHFVVNPLNGKNILVTI